LAFVAACTQQSTQQATDSNVNTDKGRDTVATQEKTPIRPIPGTNPLELMKIKQIQDELALTEEQMNQLKEVEVQVDRTPSDKSSSHPGDQEGKQTGREKVTAILSEEQLERFAQILLQIYGVSLMPEEDVTEVLSITPEQNDKLNELRQQNRDKLKNSLERVQSNDPDECLQIWTDNYQKIIDAGKQSNLKIYSILKEDQVKTLEATKGAKFELDLTKLPPICS
jgi:Spy/CpxP family protein refolding chaperone